MIWGPFLLALALGLVVSAGLYFAYLWPAVEPDEPVADSAPSVDEPAGTEGDSKKEMVPAPSEPVASKDEPSTPVPSTDTEASRDSEAKDTAERKESSSA